MTMNELVAVADRADYAAIDAAVASLSGADCIRIAGELRIRGVRSAAAARRAVQAWCERQAATVHQIAPISR